MNIRQGSAKVPPVTVRPIDAQGYRAPMGLATVLQKEYRATEELIQVRTSTRQSRDKV
jgi:hypothetical protein